MITATLWADTTSSMWVGVGLLGAGFVLGGLTLYLINRKVIKKQEGWLPRDSARRTRPPT